MNILQDLLDEISSGQFTRPPAQGAARQKANKLTHAKLDAAQAPHDPENQWQNQSLTCLTIQQICTCGHSTSYTAGFFLTQRHARTSAIRRTQTGLISDMPRQLETIQEHLTTCSQCFDLNPTQLSLKLAEDPAQARTQLLLATQDGRDFYDEQTGTLICSYPHLVKSDSDLIGARKARALFRREHPQYIFE